MCFRSSFTTCVIPSNILGGATSLIEDPSLPAAGGYLEDGGLPALSMLGRGSVMAQVASAQWAGTRRAREWSEVRGVGQGP